MKVLGVIPARFASTRFEGKPLKLISGKPLLKWVIEGAQNSKKINELIVATDDDRIYNLAQSCGVKSVMTASELPSGSDRVWSVAKDIACDYIINIQGDEPLLEGTLLDQLVDGLHASGTEMATLARPLKDPRELQNPSVAKLVVNQKSEALYFSRSAIPFDRQNQFGQVNYLKHIGLYGYRKDFLGQFCATPPIKLELIEGLEQLRALWLGAKIKVLLTDYESWGVDTPEDVIRVEEMMKRRQR